MSPSVPTGTLDEILFLMVGPMDKTIVFIDGGYLSKISKHFGRGQPYRIDLNQFAITLAKTCGLWRDEVYYYTAPPYQSSFPSTGEKERKRKYDRFINRLSRIPGFIVREGRCQKTDDGFQQKGVDTLLTMDLMKVSKRDDIKKIVLLACDTDFVPILKELRKNGIYSILFYYTDKVRNSKFSMSNYILTACNECILLTKEHFERSVHISNKNQ